jgi:hypothetical protein
MKNNLQKLEQYLQSRKRIICILTPALLGLLFMILCLIRIDQSLSLDEVRRVHLAQAEPSALIAKSIENGQPPLFIAILKLWSHFFGYYDYSMRMLSILLGAVAILLWYLLLKKRYGARFAIPIAVLLATSPILVYFGSIISPLTCALSLAAFVLLIIQTIFMKRTRAIKTLPIIIGFAVIIVVNICGLIFVYNTKTANIKELSATIATLDNGENLPVYCDSDELREVMSFYSRQPVYGADAEVNQAAIWRIVTVKNSQPAPQIAYDGWRVAEYSTMNYEPSGDTYVIVKLEKE